MNWDTETNYESITGKEAVAAYRAAIRAAALEEAARLCDAEAIEWRDIEAGYYGHADRAPKAARETAESCAAAIRALKEPDATRI